MKRYYFLFIILLFGIACSSTTWIVLDENAVDRGDYKLLESDLFLEKTGQVSPERPVIQFRVNSSNTFEYVKRIKTDRFIQRYRPRLGYVALGVGASALAGYSALEFTDSDKIGQKIALTGASATLFGVSFLNMKPVGEPQSTGETRLLRKTGVYIEADTLVAPSTLEEDLTYTISYNGQSLVRNKDISLSENTFSINFLEEINPEIFSDLQAKNIHLDVVFRDSLYNYAIPVSSVFESFVVVTSPVTALRNRPERNSNNILTDLANGSQLKMVEKDGDWIKVLYGISENWVSANDVDMIWRPSQFSNELSVVAIPNVPFGSVDVERDIPKLSEDSINKFGFIIANQSYSSTLPEKSYAQRDALLIEKYMTDALGLSQSQIFKNIDVSGSRTALTAFNRLSSGINNQQKELTVYINGYAKVDPVSDRVFLLGTDPDSTASLIDLNDLFDGLSSLPVSKLFVIADIDFLSETGSETALELLSANITTKKPNSLIVFSSGVQQSSYVYAEPNGVQKRHSIFTYFFADALKKRNTIWSDILSNVNRNVSFTSRSLYNSAQDIRSFGNDSLDITN